LETYAETNRVARRTGIGLLRRRKQMGRPIKKSRFSAEGSDGTAGRIEVTAYYPTGGALQQNDDTFIISQRGSKQFKIQQQNDSSVGTYTLVAKAPGELSEGEMCVKVTIRNTDSGVPQDAWVEKFYNNTVHFAYNNGANTGTVKYTLGAEAGEDSTVAGEGSIDVL